nr:unnamed protein product [Digitaria exilis]
MGALDLHLSSASTQHGQAKLNVEEYDKGSLLSGGNYQKENINDSNLDDYEKFEEGIMQYGYVFYWTFGVHITEGDAGYELLVAMRFLIAGTATMKSRYRVSFFELSVAQCRRNSIKVDAMKRHELPRHEVQQVICSLCGTEQEVQQVCINCGVCMGKYFCGLCKLLDDDVSKQQYHCNGCGICRYVYVNLSKRTLIGGRENFFHCSRCGCCYSIVLKNSHACVEGAMHHDCPICFEYLFESTNDVSVLPCGHTIHVKCLKEMEEHCQFACPLCSKSVCDMSKAWERLDMELANLSDSCDDKMVRILCNDCGAISEVQFHLIAHKCQSCKSYNTRQI